MATETILAWAVIVLAAAAHGLTGFGFALVGLPLLLLFEDAKSAVLTMIVLTVVLNGLIIVQSRRQITWRSAGLMTIGSLLGVPAGSYVLVVLDPHSLKQFVAATVLIFSIPMLLGYSRGLRHTRVASFLAGAISGVLQSSTGMGAPPVVLLMANQGLPKEVFRGMMVVRSGAAAALSVAVLVPTGLLPPDLAIQSLMLAPALLAGLALGTVALKLVPQALFKKLTVGIVAVTAVVSLFGSMFL